MTDQDFDFIRKLLRERSAIALEDGKQYLVESRLAPIVRELEAGVDRRPGRPAARPTRPMACSSRSSRPW